MFIMMFWPLLILFLPLVALLLYFSGRLLFSRVWLMGFARGMTGLVCVGLVGVGGYLAFDLSAYRALSQESVVATVSFNQLAPQRYEAQVSTVVRPTLHAFELNGDEWQVDAKVLTWQGPLTVLGMEPVYRLERISGRFTQLEQERSAQRTVYGLTSEGRLGVDELTPWLPWVDARFGSAAYLPMVDGGIFEVRLTPRGLIARPVNEPARLAVGQWFSE
ncbi:MAG: multidrug transporter [Saccharospirillum sp.]|nr:multidrug transporter [Saccharospirillum sp.]